MKRSAATIRQHLIWIAIPAAGFAFGVALRGVPWRSRPVPCTLPASAPRPETPAPAPEPPAPETPAIEELIAAVPREPVPAGSGLLTGFVVTDGGAPLSQVRVVLRSERSGERRSRPEDFGWSGSGLSDLERDVFSHVARKKWERASTTEVLTDAQGTFRFEGLAEGVGYGLECSLEGWEIRPFVGTSVPVRAGEHVGFLATKTPGISIRFACVLPDGSEPYRAWVRGRSVLTGQAIWFEWKPTKPSHSFEPGEHLVRATVEIAQERYDSGWLVLPVPMEGVREPVRIALRASPAIFGEVVLPPGASLEAVAVRALKVHRGEAISFFQRDWLWKRAEAKRENGWRYRIPGLSPGLYLVRAFWGPGEERPAAAETFVEVRGEPVRCDLELRPPGEDLGFLVRAYGPDGEVLRSLLQADLEGYYSSEGDTFLGASVQLRQVPVEDGAIRFFPQRSLDAIEAAAGKGPFCWLLGLCSKYGRIDLPFDPRSRKELSVRFREPASLTVFVERYAESGYARGKLTADLWAVAETPQGLVDRDRVSYDAQPDAEGRLDLGRHQPGRYRLEIEFSPEAVFFSHRVHRAPVELGAGAKEISVALPPLYDLTLVCPGVREGEKLTLVAPGYLGGTTVVVGSRGTVSFAALPAGTYTVRMLGSGGGEMSVTVPAPELVEFRPLPFNAVALGVLIEAGSIFHELGFRDGDRIVGVADELFEDAADLEKRLRAAAEEEDLYLLVEDWVGRRRSVAVPPKRFLAELERSKGSVIPTRRK